MNEKISVIVPVYNIENYIAECLDSIINQIYKNLEIIVINDGSTDNSLEIINKYKAIDNRIIVIDQENEGLSCARNTGIDIATGDYYVFVDGDDVILPDTISYLHFLATIYDCDIAIGHYFEITDHYNLKDLKQPLEKLDLYANKQKFKILYKYPIESVVQWGKIFKKEIFNNIKYPSKMFHEDEFVAHLEIDKAEKIIVTNRQLYLYRSRDNSITTTNKTIRNYHVMLALYNRASFFYQKKMPYFKRMTIRWLLYQFKLISDSKNICQDYPIYYPKAKTLRKKAIELFYKD